MKNLIFLFTAIFLFVGMSSTMAAWISDPESDPGAEVHIRSGSILLIVGDENGTAEPGKGTGDLFIRNRLEKVLGHEVILGIDVTQPGELFEAAQKADLVMVSESIHSTYLQDKLKTVTTPIINYESFIQDEMGLTAKEPSGDPGEPEDFAYGVRDKDTGIDIIMPGHPLAAGMRIGFFLEEENVTGTSNFMTGEGIRLFDAAVKFALEQETE